MGGRSCHWRGKSDTGFTGQSPLGGRQWPCLAAAAKSSYIMTGQGLGLAQVVLVHLSVLLKYCIYIFCNVILNYY